MYSRFSNYDDILGKDVLIYVYSKDEEIAKRQLQNIMLFCKKNNLNCLSSYVDNFGSNKLNNKISLKKMINENSNINVIISNIDRLSRDIMDIFEINKLCHQKNIGIYDINSDDFISQNIINLIDKYKNEINKGGDEKMQRKIKALVVEPNQLPRVEMIENNLSAKQKIVNGNIEYVSRDYYPDVIFICNEEGKIRGMPFNRDIGGDILAGPFIIVGDDPEIGEDRSLTDEQIKKYQDVFNENSITDTNKKIMELYLNNDYEI
jgi:hypothetical protein